VLNSWKLGILSDLYHRTMQRLTGETATRDAQQQADDRRRQARGMVQARPDAEWFGQQIELLPVPYLEDTPPKEIVTRLEQLRGLNRRQAISWGRFLDDRRVVEYSVGTYEDATPGIFHRLTGVLSSQGCGILSAEIHTLADALVLDRFVVEDTDFTGPPPPGRLDEICHRLVQALEQPSDERPAFRRLWKSRSSRTQSQLASRPARVQVDNATSERHTILDVFADDRMGLLYAITRTLFELGLSVSVAKIATYVDQVVDVFYVTDREGRKIEEDQRLEEIRHRLIAAIDELAEA
jgi:[protein-PII] uridylyltransferase